jgi:hypothetical protein
MMHTVKTKIPATVTAEGERLCQVRLEYSFDNGSACRARGKKGAGFDKP